MVVAGGWAWSQRFMVCWKRSTLPQVVGWLGREFFWRTRSLTSSVSKPLRLVRPPWAKRVVNTKPLSVKVENGTPWSAMAARKVVHDDGSGDGLVGGDRQGVAGVVVEPGEDLDVGAVGEAVVGEVGLPGFVGLFGWKRMYEERGFFFGCGVTGRRGAGCDRSSLATA